MKTHRNDRRQRVEKPFISNMKDVHHHLSFVNTYNRRPDLKPYGRKPNHRAHELMMENFFDYDKSHAPHKSS